MKYPHMCIWDTGALTFLKFTINTKESYLEAPLLSSMPEPTSYNESVFDTQTAFLPLSQL